jgi:hypothetical protein
VPPEHKVRGSNPPGRAISHDFNIVDFQPSVFPLRTEFALLDCRDSRYNPSRSIAEN